MFRGHVVRTGIGVITSTALATVALAQDNRPSRAADEPVATAAPSSAVDDSDRVSRIVDRFMSFAADSGSRKGVAPAWGDIVPGSGPAAGASFQQGFAADSIVLRGLALGSVRGSTLFRSSLTWPAFADGRAALRIVAERQDALSTQFFGIAASQLRGRSVYRLRSSSVSASASARLHRRVWFTATSGVVTARVAQGRGPTMDLIEAKYDYGDAPGLFLSPRYLRTAGELKVDWRDVPAYPTRGGEVRIAISRYDDVSRSALSFVSIDADTMHYFRLHDASTLVLRGRFMRADAFTYNRVPFYFLPSLGGNDSLRGYADFRFKDRNAALGTAEYRWSARPTFDVAVFVDAGTTGETLRQLSQTPPHRSYGVGVRFHTNQSSTIRVDVARGREGMRVGATMTAPFRASPNHAIFVP